jgi:hypothetical protein
MTALSHSVSQHFDRAEANVRAIYDRILVEAHRFGPVEEDPKKTSIHLVRRTAFAGVAMRRNVIILTLKAAKDIASARIIKHERASANRWHLDVRLERPEDVDRELVSWMAQAYALAE